MKDEQQPTKPIFTPEKEARERYAGGVSRVTRWRWTREGRFPRPVSIGPGRMAFVTAELEAWASERIAARANGNH